MSVEERFLDAIEDEEVEEIEVEDEPEDEPSTYPDWLEGRHNRLQRKNLAAIEGFLGKGSRAKSVVILPGYYGELLTWALHRHIEEDGWKVVRTLGYRRPEPIYLDVNTDYNQSENLLMNG